MATFLIVDDQELNLHSLKLLLEEYGYRVITATNGAKALEKAREIRPDYIISDILMPVMDGFTLCKEWQKSEDLKKIPFIFFSATYTDAKDEELGYRLGAKCFIVKPIEPVVFINKIQEVIAEVEKEARKSKTLPEVEEQETQKLYSERVVKKLEKKMMELEREIIVRKQAEVEKEKLIMELQEALAEIKTLRGIISICAHCKQVRDDKGHWNVVESYVELHTDAKFSHSICPDCSKKYYPDLLD